MTTPAARNRSFRATLASLANVMAGARDCAAAAEAGRRPSARALRAVGIADGHWPDASRR